MKNHLQKTLVLALIIASGPFAAADANNIIVNPNLQSSGDKIEGWKKMLGTLESSENPGNGEACGKMNLTSIVTTDENSDSPLAKSSIIQTIEAITPGDYMLSFSLSGKNLKAIYVVLRFQKEPGLNNATLLGTFKKYINAQQLPADDEWKKYIAIVNVPPGSETGYLIVESFAEPDQEAYSLINNVKLVKQED
jgi:hypothetical protein